MKLPNFFKLCRPISRIKSKIYDVYLDMRLNIQTIIQKKWNSLGIIRMKDGK